MGCDKWGCCHAGGGSIEQYHGSKTFWLFVRLPVLSYATLNWSIFFILILWISCDVWKISIVNFSWANASAEYEVRREWLTSGRWLLNVSVMANIKMKINPPVFTLLLNVFLVWPPFCELPCHQLSVPFCVWTSLWLVGRPASTRAWDGTRQWQADISFVR